MLSIFFKCQDVRTIKWLWGVGGKGAVYLDCFSRYTVSATGSYWLFSTADSSYWSWQLLVPIGCSAPRTAPVLALIGPGSYWFLLVVQHPGQLLSLL